MAGYSLRIWLARHLRDLLAAGAVGEIQALTGVFACEPLDDAWLGSADSGGGASALPGPAPGRHASSVRRRRYGRDFLRHQAARRRRHRRYLGVPDPLRARAVAQCPVTRAASTLFSVDVVGNAGKITLRG